MREIRLIKMVCKHRITDLKATKQHQRASIYLRCVSNFGDLQRAVKKENDHLGR